MVLHSDVDFLVSCTGDKLIFDGDFEFQPESDFYNENQNQTFINNTDNFSMMGTTISSFEPEDSHSNYRLISNSETYGMVHGWPFSVIPVN